MSTTQDLHFNQAALLAPLNALSDQDLDAVDFGVIGFDHTATVCRYGAHERRASGLREDQVLGLPLFDVVAPCMNNYLVAQRFEDAAACGEALDETLDYVLTLRMRPQPVKLRLLAAPATPLRYVLVQRSL